MTSNYLFNTFIFIHIAAVLTSKGILSGFLLLLLNFPEMQERIRQEIYEVIGDIRMPTIEDMCKMPYTQACMLEALRYQSHLPVTAGHCNSQCEVEFEGYTIPKNTVVRVAVYFHTHTHTHIHPKNHTHTHTHTHTTTHAHAHTHDKAITCAL